MSQQSMAPSERTLSMQLVSGQRLEGAGDSRYIVTGCLETTDCDSLYSARKVFFNYRYDDREFYEVADDEWLDVLIRVPAYSDSTDESDVQQRNGLLWYEMTEVLTTETGWFPQPLDWIELPDVNQESGDDQDETMQPMLVFSRPRGETLREWRGSHEAASSKHLRVVAEILDLIESLHHRGQVIGAVGPDDFLIDEFGRLHCLAGDRVIPVDRNEELRPFFPPERFPTAFTAPEILSADVPFDARSDLYSWARLFIFLMTGIDSEGEEDPKSGRPVEFGAAERNQFEAMLTEAIGQEPHVARSMAPNKHPKSSAAMVEAWFDCLTLCLASNPEGRPPSIRDLREDAANRASRFSIKRLLKSFRKSRR